MITCPKCGQQNADGTQFCVNCGQNLTVPVQQQPVAPPPPPPPVQQPYYQPAPQPVYPAPMVVQSPPGKGMAIASLVLGIISLVIPFGGLPCAVVGLILGIIGRQKLTAAGQPSGMAMAGIICSIIALAWSIIFIIICVGSMSAANDVLNSYSFS